MVFIFCCFKKLCFRKILLKFKITMFEESEQNYTICNLWKMNECDEMLVMNYDQHIESSIYVQYLGIIICIIYNWSYTFILIISFPTMVILYILFSVIKQMFPLGFSFLLPNSIVFPSETSIILWVLRNAIMETCQECWEVVALSMWSYK